MQQAYGREQQQDRTKQLASCDVVGGDAER